MPIAAHRVLRTTVRGLIAALLLLAFGRAGESEAQAIIKVNDNVNFKLGFLIQPQADFQEVANATNNGSGGYQQNLLIRRVRLILGGQVAKNVFFFAETENGNLGKSTQAVGATTGVKSPGTGFNLLDAAGEWRIAKAAVRARSRRATVPRPTRLGQPCAVVLEGGRGSADRHRGGPRSGRPDRPASSTVPLPGLGSQRRLHEVVDVGPRPGGRRVQQHVAPRVEHRGDQRGRPVLGLQQGQRGQDLAVVGVQRIGDRHPAQAGQHLGGLVDQDPLDVLAQLVHGRGVDGPATGCRPLRPGPRRHPPQRRRPGRPRR